MAENYLQYAGGYQKDNIDESDIDKAIADIQTADDEHGAFWVSVMGEGENVIEVNKDLSFSVIFKGEETRHQARNWNELKELFIFLLNERFEVIKSKIG